MYLKIVDHKNNTIGTIKASINLITEKGVISDVVENLLIQFVDEDNYTFQCSHKSKQKPNVYFCDLTDEQMNNAVFSTEPSNILKTIRLFHNKQIDEVREAIKELAHASHKNSLNTKSRLTAYAEKSIIVNTELGIVLKILS